MVATTAVASAEVIGQGSELYASFDNETTWDLVVGLEKIPPIGLEGNLIAFMSIEEIEERVIGGVKKTPEWALVFRRIGDDTIQDALLTASDSTDLAVQTVVFQARYRSGDIFTVDVVLSGNKMEEIDQGDGFQLCGISGKQSGPHRRTKVV